MDKMVVESFLKYYRLRNLAEAVGASDQITSVCVRGGRVVLGTDHGWLHVCAVDTGEILYTMRVQEDSMPVKRVTMDESGRHIAGTCLDGTVFVVTPTGHTHTNSKKGSTSRATGIGGLSGGMEIVKVAIQEKGSAVWIGHFPKKRESHDNKYGDKNADDDRGERDVMLLVGTQSGALMQCATSPSLTPWYGKGREQVLYGGAMTPVESVNCRGRLVAWVDAEQVRVMNIESGQPLCYLSQLVPPTAKDHRLLRCTLVWETEGSLLVGWGSNLKQLTVSLQNMTTKVIVDCLVDGEICGLVPHGDKDVVLAVRSKPSPKRCSAPKVLGSGGTPLMSPIPGVSGNYTPDSDISRASSSCTMSSMHQSEPSAHLMIVNRSSGVVKLVDRVGTVAPTSHFIVSMDPQSTPFRGLLVLGSELIVIEGSSFDDRISLALRVCDYAGAANCAKTGAALGLLRKFTLWDILSLHIMTLFDRGDDEEAASECARLLGDDALGWAHWIMVFIERKRIDRLCSHIPKNKPQLDSAVYELVLEFFLAAKRPQSFRTCLCHWLGSPEDLTRDASSRDSFLELGGRQLFNYRSVCHKLKQLLDDPPQDLSQWRLAVFQECHGMLLMALNRPFDAVSAFLNASQVFYMVEMNETGAESIGNIQMDKICKSERIFTTVVMTLIITFDLFAKTSERIADLAMMSPSVVSDFLPSHINYYSLASTVRQLRNHRFLLHVYLHTIFVTRRELYNKEEYASYHMLQIPLYVSFTRKNKGRELARGTAGASGIRVSDVMLPDLVVFLKGSKHAPMELALEECKFHVPPLYLEIAYIYASTFRCRAAVEILINKCHDIEEAVRFVEIFGPPDLLMYVAEQCISRGACAVGKLLDCLAHRNAMEALPNVIRRLPKDLHVPRLAHRLKNLIGSWRSFELNQGVLHTLHAKDVRALCRRRASGASGRAAMLVQRCVCCEYCGELVTRSEFNAPEARAVVFFPESRAHHALCHRRALEEVHVRESLVATN